MTEQEENGVKNVYQDQCLAIGNGETYTKLAQNPVVTGDMMPEHFSREHFRDPKIWKEEDGYYMVVGNKTDDGKPHVVLFHSEDAISWEYVSVLAKDDTGMLGTMWECPDFFCLDGAYVLITSPQNLSADEEFIMETIRFIIWEAMIKTSICSIMTQFTRLMTDWIFTHRRRCLRTMEEEL